MNKAELISAVASKTSLTKAQVTEVLRAFEDVVVNAISEGEKVQMTGFLTIAPRIRSARKGFNPLSGQEIDIPAKMGLRLIPGTRLRKVVEELDIKTFAEKQQQQEG